MVAINRMLWFGAQSGY